MRTMTALLAAVAVGSMVAAGGAFAASEASAPSKQAMPQTAVEKDFGKLSADGSKAYQDLTLTRLAIYDGDTAKAKTMIDEADTAFGKAKSDDSVFMKAERDLMTPQQMAARQASKQAAKEAGGKDAMSKEASDSNATAKQTASEQTVTMTKQGQEAAAASHSASDQASTSGSATDAQGTKVAWLPVDGGISLDEDYTMSAAKTKAVADANKSLAKGDSKGALDKLKLADVDMSVALEVVPLQQTISDVHQAASLIDSGKYYEGSQMLRKVQASARYDVTDYVATPAGKLSASHASDAGASTTH